jgi:periplasmic protein TonB
VFDEVTKQEGGKQAAKRAGYVFGSTVFQVLLVAAIISASAAIKAKVIDEPVVPVTIVRQATPPPPPPPPAPPPAARKRPPSEKPRTDLPKPPPPQALLQPKEVQEQMKAPDPNEPPEPEYDYGDAAAGEGVVGGVVGGAPQAKNEIEDAPAFATAGYRKPQMAQAGCVQNAVRVPRELAGFVSGPVQVKFAIAKDGTPTRFETLTSVPDRRIAEEIWKAVQSCKWVAGADAQGRPTSIWVILPIRFAGG